MWCVFYGADGPADAVSDYEPADAALESDGEHLQTDGHRDLGLRHQLALRLRARHRHARVLQTDAQGYYLLFFIFPLSSFTYSLVFS